MHERVLVLACIALLFLAATPAAHAAAVPFSATYELGEQGGEAGAAQSFDTGLIGACDREPFCTGFRLTADTSTFGGGTTAGSLTLRGYACVADATSACSVDGVPFTGVRITERVVDTPEAHLDPFLVHLSLCVWRGSLPESPDACSPATPAEGIRLDETGNLAAPVPPELGLTFGT